MQTINLAIDGREVTARRGATVLEAAREAGIYIPTLCYHPALKPFGACRICVVEIEGMRGFPTSCTTPAAEGMVVKTDTTQVEELRRNVLSLILSEHPNACLTCHRAKICDPYDVCLRHAAVTERCVYCPKNKRCELQDVALKVKLYEIPLPYAYRNLPVERGDPFYDRDYNYCIVCARCTRICGEGRGIWAIEMTNRGEQTLPGTAFGSSLRESGCIFCGACIDACPTNALMEKEGKWIG